MSEALSHASTGERSEAPARAKTSSKLDLNVETLRGLAILMVVVFHVIGPKPYTGLEIQQPGSIYHLVTDILDYIQMPLFAFLSGYVYAMKPFSGDPGRFVKNKARRLLVPMLVVGTVFALVKSLAPGTNTPMAPSDFLTLHIVPVQHFWFVEALFWIFLLMMLGDSRQWLSSGRSFAVAGAAACGVFLAWPKPPEYLGLAGVVFLLPAFLFGVACYRFRDAIFRPAVLWPAAILTAMGTGLVIMGLAGATDPFMPQSLPSLVVGCGVSLFLMVSQWKQRWFTFLGAYAYSIYIFHVFGTSGSRIILQKLGVTDYLPLLIAGVICGVVGPIVVDKIACRYRWSRMLLLGKLR